MTLLEAPPAPPEATSTAPARALAPPVGRPRAPRLGRRARGALGALVVALDVVVAGPLLAGPRLDLLDYGAYPIGAHPPTPLSSLGFPPGPTSRAPVYALLRWFFHALPFAPLTLLPFLVVAPLSCIGFARLLRGRAVAIGAATVLFTVNPFVYERMANGQVYVVMGYALLPLLVGLAIHPLASLGRTAAVGGLLGALEVALSVHYVFVLGLALVVVAVVHAAGRQWRVVATSAAIAATSAALSLYWLVPAVASGLGAASRVSTQDLAAFRTVGDPTWGLAVNVFGLYGFFRPGAPLVKDALSGWPFLGLALLVVGAAGARALARRGSGGRALAATCVVLAVCGGLVAMGDQGPTGGVYRFLFAHLPGFEVMREAEKFSALLALAYAISFGAGVEAVLRAVRRTALRRCGICLLAALPLAYGATELWGFSSTGYAAVTPAGLGAADRAMPAGATALVLPWSAYLAVPWLGGRVVANPLLTSFARPVVGPDDLEAGEIVSESPDPRSGFLAFLLEDGASLRHAGRDLAALGIDDVVLAKAPGWRSYAWLARQADLTLVLSNATALVYRVDEQVPRAYAPRRALDVRDWGGVLALAEHAPLVDYAIHVAHARPGPLVAPVAAPVALAPAVLRAPGGSPVAQPVVVPASATDVVLTEPAYPGWQLPGATATTQFGVTTAFARTTRAPSGRLVATYAPYGTVRAADILGACLFALDLAALVALTLAARRRRARGAATGGDVVACAAHAPGGHWHAPSARGCGPARR